MIKNAILSYLYKGNRADGWFVGCVLHPIDT